MDTQTLQHKPKISTTSKSVNGTSGHIDDIRTSPSPLISTDPLQQSSFALCDRAPVTAKKAKSHIFNSRDELNWFDREEILANQRLFDGEQQARFVVAEKKRTQYPDGFDKGNYFDNLIPVISSGYERAIKILGCGFDARRKQYPCDQWALCSKCSYMRGVRACDQFKGTYDKDDFFFLTLGFDGDIPINETNSTDARAYWRMNEEAIKHLLKADLIHGAYFAHEIKVRSFLPLRINPHTHAIISASEFPHEIVDSLKEMIGSAKGINLTPSIHVDLIPSVSDHDRCIRYLTKAMELKDPYMSAWNRHCEDNRGRVPELNREMKVFLDAQAAASMNFNRVVYLGNLRSQNGKKFIGFRTTKPKRVRKKKRKKAIDTRKRKRV